MGNRSRSLENIKLHAHGVTEYKENSMVDNIFSKAIKKESGLKQVNNSVKKLCVDIKVKHYKRKSDKNLSSGPKSKKTKILGTTNLAKNNLIKLTSSDSKVGILNQSSISQVPPQPPKFQKEDILKLLMQDAVSPEKIIAENIKSDKINKITKVNIEKLDVGNCSNMEYTKKRVDSDIKINQPKTSIAKFSNKKLNKMTGKKGKKSKLIKSLPVDQIKEETLTAEPEKSYDSNSFISENQCTQCSKSSANIMAIIKQVNKLENRLMTDSNQKEDLFKKEKESWKLRENEFMEALATQDNLKEMEEIKAELKATDKALYLKISEKQDQAMKIVKMQEINDDLSEKNDALKKELEHFKNLDLSEKYDRVKKELAHFKNLSKIKTEAGDLEDKVRQKEDFITVQAKAIVALELDIFEKDDLINSLRSDLNFKEKDMIVQKEGLLQLKQKNKLLETADKREKELNEMIQQNKNEFHKKIEERKKELNEKVKFKDQIISKLELKTTNQLGDLKKEIFKKKEFISNILKEKEEYVNKYAKAQYVNDSLKQENEKLNTENKDVKHWKDTEVEKLRSSVQVRVKNMVEKNLARENFFKQKILTLENLLNEKR